MWTHTDHKVKFLHILCTVCCSFSSKNSKSYTYMDFFKFIQMITCISVFTNCAMHLWHKSSLSGSESLTLDFDYYSLNQIWSLNMNQLSPLWCLCHRSPSVVEQNPSWHSSAICKQGTLWNPRHQSWYWFLWSPAFCQKSVVLCNNYHPCCIVWIETKCKYLFRNLTRESQHADSEILSGSMNRPTLTWTFPVMAVKQWFIFIERTVLFQLECIPADTWCVPADLSVSEVAYLLVCGIFKAYNATGTKTGQFLLQFFICNFLRCGINTKKSIFRW
jgi:hypothetical protein